MPTLETSLGMDAVLLLLWACSPVRPCALVSMPPARLTPMASPVLNFFLSPPLGSMEEEAEFKEFASQPGAMDRIFARIAPQACANGRRAPFCATCCAPLGNSAVHSRSCLWRAL